MISHYTPCDEGYRIVGSPELFNRTLYGGHGNDHLAERFFTFAGDQPIVMGAVTDGLTRTDCAHAKCGALLAGVALTPGLWLPIYFYHGETGGDRTAGWFHEMPGTVATYREGWMEYRVSPFFQCFPRITAAIEVFPLRSLDGFLMHLEVSSDQRVHLVFGFGGVTGYKGHLGHQYFTARQFAPEDCAGNTVSIVDDRCAKVVGPRDADVRTEMTVMSSFDSRPAVADARTGRQPGLFLGSTAGGDAPMLRMSTNVVQGVTTRASVAVLRNASAEAASDVRGLLTVGAGHELAARTRHALHATASSLQVASGDRMLDLTVPGNVLALDACWHGNTFCHGSFDWHRPYLGWRNWYGATVAGWSHRVQQAFRTHAAHQVLESEGTERAAYAGPGPFAEIRNSTGFIPDMPDGRRTMFYNMQEVAVDMILHSIRWTGDFAYAREVFPVIDRVLAWESRVLDSDGDGLYENWLNTWISDAHSYNGGACTQSSVYNWRANTTMAALAEVLGLDGRRFSERAQRTREALFRDLWLPERGILAEYRDTVGNRLVHPSPELATIYHAIEAGIVDDFQAYQMLRFTETEIRNERSIARGGRLAWSSNWYPQLYSSCGLYTAENLHLAWAYFACGLRAKGHEILSAVVDSHFLGRVPGATGHCMTESGYSDGSHDFTDILSMHLRTVVEGVFGVRRDLLSRALRVAPAFPTEWTHASLATKEMHVQYERTGNRETLRVEPVGPLPERTVLILELPLRLTDVEGVTLDGEPLQEIGADGGYGIRPGIGLCSLVVRSPAGGSRALEIRHAGSPPPMVQGPGRVASGDAVSAEIIGGTLEGFLDPTSCLQDPATTPTSLHGRVSGTPGNHTVFLRAARGDWRGWMPLDLVVAESPRPALSAAGIPACWEPLDIGGHLRLPLDEIHRQEFRSPRPASYSIMTSLNGRFGWDWNQRGYNAVEVDDRLLRSCGGIIRSTSGIPFLTPPSGPNVACASVWDHFPTELVVPLRGRAEEIALFLVGVTNPMQSRVENGRVEVRYADADPGGAGGVTESLVNPVSFDDWLHAPLQTAHETLCWSDHNHGIVLRVALDPGRELDTLRVIAVANEVVIGVLGVTLKRPSRDREAGA